MEAEQLEGIWGALIWLGFTFFLCVGIYMISTHESMVAWSNLDDHEIAALESSGMNIGPA